MIYTEETLLGRHSPKVMGGDENGSGSGSDWDPGEFAGSDEGAEETGEDPNDETPDMDTEEGDDF